MDHHLEVELKWALSPEDHARLAAALPGLLGVARVLAQENRFLDSTDLRLRRARMNLRLRRENAALQLTCKRRASGGDAQLHRHDEWERWLDPALWARVPVAGAALDPHHGRHPRPAGTGGGRPRRGAAHQLRRLRQRAPRVPQQRRELLCLDRTTFSGARRDRELEIETPDPAASAARWGAQLRGLGIAVTPGGSPSSRAS